MTLNAVFQDDTTAPYTMNAAVYATLIRLCTDICRRNGKTKLLWFADKAKSLAYIPAPDEMVITVHRWFANKSCPGDWLYSRLGDLAEKVTAALDGKAEEATDPLPAPAVSAQDLEDTIWEFLYSKIGNAYGAAGVMGNLYAESALNPRNLQNSFEKSLGLSDDAYTAAVDSGAYTNFVRDSAGYGLAQWTYWSRKQALLDFVRAEGKSIGDLSMQLCFLWKELSENYPALLSTLHDANSVEKASTAVLTQYERPADQGERVQKNRAEYGERFFQKYAGKEAAPSAPFLVRVKATDLNIRTGPGTDFSRTGKFTGAGVFTIVEVRSGQGSDAGWGRLKSGAGWISLDFVSIVR